MNTVERVIIVLFSAATALAITVFLAMVALEVGSDWRSKRIVVEGVELPAELAQQVTTAEITDRLREGINNINARAARGWFPIGPAKENGGGEPAVAEDKSDVTISGATTYRSIVQFVEHKLPVPVTWVNVTISSAGCPLSSRSEDAPTETPKAKSAPGEPSAPNDLQFASSNLRFAVTSVVSRRTMNSSIDQVDRTPCRPLSELNTAIQYAAETIWLRVNPKTAAKFLQANFESGRNDANTEQSLSTSGTEDAGLTAVLFRGFASLGTVPDDNDDAIAYFDQALDMPTTDKSEGQTAYFGRALAERNNARYWVTEWQKDKTGQAQKAQTDLATATDWFDKAIKDFKQAVNQDNGLYASYFLAVMRLYYPPFDTEENAKLALQDLAELNNEWKLHKKPSDVWVGYAEAFQGLALIKTEDLAGAKSHLLKAQQLNPRYGKIPEWLADVHVALAAQEEKSGKLEAAADDYEYAATRYRLAGIRGVTDDVTAKEKDAQKRSDDMRAKAKGAGQAAATARQRSAAQSLRNGAVAQTCTQLHAAIALFNESGLSAAVDRLASWSSQLKCETPAALAFLNDAERARLADEMQSAADQMPLPEQLHQPSPHLEH